MVHLKKVGVIYMFLFPCCVGNNSSHDLSDPISTLKYFSSLIRTIMNYKRVSLTRNPIKHIKILHFFHV